MNSVVQALTRNIIIDIIGLGFAGTAMYGLVTGRLSEAALVTTTGLAAAYLGLKFPTDVGGTTGS